MSVQGIRPSQLITTYGPGSIVEAPGGPGVMRSLAGSGLFSRRPVTEFEVTEVRLNQLLGGAGLVRIPTNAELGRSPLSGIYAANAFPSWSLCVPHSILYHQLQRGAGCPSCSDQSEATARKRAVRFVRACGGGHLDDVDWPRLMKHTKESCAPTYLLWKGGGGALRNVIIECPECGGDVNLGVAYSKSHPCSGRFPEQGSERPGCGSESRILHRGAANVRVADTATALTIPDNDTPLHQVLGSQTIRTLLAVEPPQSRETFLAAVERLSAAGLVRDSARDEIRRHSEHDLLKAIEDVLGATRSGGSGRELRTAELVQLQRAAEVGAPPQARGASTDHYFEVRPSDTRILPLGDRIQLRVAAVSRLRVVTAQTAYRRLIRSEPSDNAPVSVAYPMEDRNWYPAVALFGEGIFIDAPRVETEQLLRGSAVHSWIRADPAHSATLSDLAPVDSAGNEAHPLYIWWHTLSHGLLRALALDSGYSSASLRERVYARVEGGDGQAHGGVLIYTTQPGGDGTLGGLVSLVPEFERILEPVLAGLDMCSNDPLCLEETFVSGRANGSACYACLFASETSCEIRNMSLDRHVLLESLA